MKEDTTKKKPRRQHASIRILKLKKEGEEEKNERKKEWKREREIRGRRSTEKARVKEQQ